MSTVDPGEALQRIFDVRGSRVIVTGAASGLGLAITEAMIDCGAVVTMVDINVDSLRRHADRLSDRAGKVRRVVPLDISDVAAVRKVFDDVVTEDGGLDVLFANAGIATASPRVEGELPALDEGWRRGLEVNLEGTFATVQSAAAVMRRQGSGCIVITASTAGLRGDPLVSYAYTAAKGALVNITRHAALELAPHGVRVNAIAPGPFKTNIGAGARPAGVRPADRRTSEEAWSRTVPLGRMGEPAELKGLALLLGSSAGSYITGAVYPIDGGALVNYAR